MESCLRKLVLDADWTVLGDPEWEAGSRWHLGGKNCAQLGANGSTLSIAGRPKRKFWFKPSDCNLANHWKESWAATETATGANGVIGGQEIQADDLPGEKDLFGGTQCVYIFDCRSAKKSIPVHRSRIWNQEFLMRSRMWILVVLFLMVKTVRPECRRIYPGRTCNNRTHLDSGARHHD